MKQLVFRGVITGFVGVLGFYAAAVAEPIPLYKDPNAPIEERVQDLIGRMTLEEKVRMMAGEDKNTLGHDGIPANERLGIPSMEIAHGPCGFKGWFEPEWDEHAPIEHGTYFPAPIAMAASWDRVSVSNMTARMAEEIRASGAQYNGGPAMNIIRDPRGGRSFEYFTEDPYLNGQIASAYTHGLQSRRVGAIAKHFVANNQELNRHSLSANVGMRALREIYFPGFKAVVQKGGTWSIMNAYNKVNGVYCAEQKFLLTDVLRGEWGFDGFVMSDWSSVHSTVATANAGMDLEMPSAVFYGQKLVDAVHAGDVPEASIDRMAGNVLRGLFRAGAFDEKPSLDKSILHSVQNTGAAREGAVRSMVLLKNDNDVLPFDRPSIKSIAVIGPNGDYGKHFRSGKYSQLLFMGGGSASFPVDSENMITPFEGIKAQAADGVSVTYAPGCYAETGYGSATWLKYVRAPSGEPGLRATYYKNMSLSGEPANSEITTQFTYNWQGQSLFPDIRKETGGDNWSVKFEGTLTPPETRTYTFSVKNYGGTARIFINNVLVVENEGNRRHFSKEGQIDLTAGEEVNIRLEYVRTGFFADADFGWDYENIQWLKEAEELARESDVVVLCVGLSGNMGEEEDGDRLTLDLPPVQEKLIRQITAVNPDTAVVVIAGSAITMDDWIDSADAVLMAWYPGEQGGNALYDLIFGGRNPAGRLPITFPKSLDQYPEHQYTADKQVSYKEGVFVGYRYFNEYNKEPLFPFGYGLSYTTFDYSDLKLTPFVMDDKRHVRVSLTVRNSGDRSGDEVVQLYVRDVKCSLKRPDKELKEFARISLNPGECRRVHFLLDDSAFSFFDDQVSNDWKFEDGDFDILVGPSSADTRLSGTVYLTSSFNHTPVVTSVPDVYTETGCPYTYQIIAQDPEGDAVSFAAETIPGWLNFDKQTGLLSGTPSEDDIGIYSVALLAVDGSGGCVQRFNLTVSKAGNDAPVVTSVPVTRAIENEVYSYVLTAGDADGDSVSFKGVTVPKWLEFNSETGHLTGMPTPDDLGEYPVVLSADDGTSVVTQAFYIVVFATPMSDNILQNGSLESGNSSGWNLSPDGDAVVVPGEASDGIYALRFRDVSGDGLIHPTRQIVPVSPDMDYILSYSINRTSKTSGAFVVRVGPDSIARKVYSEATEGWQSDQLTFNSGSRSSINLEIYADGNFTDTAYLDDVVLKETACTNVPPVVTSVPVTNAVVGNVYNYKLTAADAEKDKLNFSGTVIPEGFVFDPESGVLSGIPFAAGNFTVELNVDDDVSSVTQAFSIRVEPEKRKRSLIRKFLGLF